MDVGLIVKKIKEKKELKGISDEVIKKEINSFLSKNNKLKKRILKSKRPEKSSSFKTCVKKVRAKLRKIHGGFKLEEFMNVLEDEPRKEILKYHKSTKERLPYYKEVYRKIFGITGVPSSVLDLGCGLNPISFPVKCKYHAYDINNEEINFLNKYFKLKNKKGKAYVKDILSVNIFPKTDLCLIFKVVDLLDKKGHKNTEKILKKLRSKFVVVSFSTKTLSKRKMRHPERGWIEKLCARLGFSFKKFSIENEIFYILRKS